MNELGTKKEKLNQKVSAFSNALRASAEKHLAKKEVKINQNERSEDLKALFETRQRLKEEGAYDRAQKMTNQIRKQIRKETLDKTIKNLEDNLWYDIKKAKASYMPSHTKLLNEKGEPTTSNERPNILADHFEKKQWAINNDRDRETYMHKIFEQEASVKTDRITIEEVIRTIKKLKNNKSPGPDGIPIEFYKFLEEDCIDIVTDILNHCWETETMPDEMELAELVTLYKKGNVEDPANYRPIALLNTLYKMYASIIQKRLSDGIEDRIWETQFGFRKKKSTSQPLFITRRLQDQAESTGDKLFLIFLDWEKAFDKVDQEKLIEAMTRLNVPTKIINILKSFYVNPRFRVKDREGKSDYRRQRAGIRQGCPLSPYLFICLMSVLFNDVHLEVEGKLLGRTHDYFNWWELIYADDTMLIGRRAREINILLAAIEKEAEKYI